MSVSMDTWGIDFGDTSSPKFGLTHRPVDWVKLLGVRGESFVAPSLALMSEPISRL